MSQFKRKLGKSVLKAAQERIEFVFDTFPRIYLSFSAGKDSTVMFHLVAAEARKRNRKIGVLLIDLEAQYAATIKHGLEMFALYADIIEPFWVSLPLNLRNAVSQFEPQWTCFDANRQPDWVRNPPQNAITDHNYFPFYRSAMEFEEFAPAFGHWYGQGELTACFVGIRSDESINRWRTIAGHGTKFENLMWTNWMSKSLYNIYPIYDWQTKDIWVYHAKAKQPYNRLYDLMHQAGLSIHQMRICQPYGDDQRKGLWLFQLLEPDAWQRVVARVSGANSGALYSQESGNIQGNQKISKPENHTWESYAKLLLTSLPPKTREHYQNKIDLFIRWWQDKGFQTLPDEADPKLEADKKAPSWRRICKVLLKNDYWCKTLSFGQHKSEHYEKYKKLMQKRRAEWGIYR